MACVLAVGLEARALAQSEIPVPPPPAAAPLPHDRVFSLMGKVRELAGLGTLSTGLEQALSQGLVKTAAALKVGDARAAVRRLGTFERQTSALVSGGVLADAVGAALIDESSRARAHIGQLAFAAGAARPQSWSLTGCPEPQPCVHLRLYVDRRASVRGERDGSADRPFRAMADALARAADADACGVELHVADGIYAETVVVSRHTVIDGESRDGVLILGSIVNNAGADLTVRDVRIANLDGRAAIFTDVPCATTTVTGVLVERSAGFGIYQRGGALTLLASIVRNTEAEAGSRLAGTAIYLTGGVQAALGLVEISDNATSAVVAAGPETRVYATSVVVSRTRVNPFFAGEAWTQGDLPAAVEVRDEALLLMEFSDLTRNELAGLRVRDGARAHFRYGQISHTLAVPDSSVATANAVAMSDGSVHFDSFTLTRGELLGLQVASAFATASSGEVSWHPIGVNLQGLPPPGDPAYTIESAVACLSDQVLYRRNDVAFDAEDLPVPCVEGACPPAPCRRVVFECTWCGQ